jgi:5'-3' exonuclease
MSSTPLLLCDGHNLLFRACFGTPAQIWSRDEPDKRDLTTEFMFFALLRKGINSELPGWPEVIVVFDGENGSASGARQRPPARGIHRVRHRRLPRLASRQVAPHRQSAPHYHPDDGRQHLSG